ncbi:MAG: glycine zipper 2TM domain-containing protein [Proteobacteria bacterium]|nr:glycine zipper 2TM domain-containing protein [Pseudomonadota bacterium]
MASASLAFAGEAPAPTSQTCQQHQTNNTVAGAAVGAVVGGVVGNNVAASGHHGAGTALGAVVGGVTGGVIGHNVSNCDAAHDTPEVIDTGKQDEPPPPAPAPTNYPPK